MNKNEMIDRLKALKQELKSNEKEIIKVNEDLNSIKLEASDLLENQAYDGSFFSKLLITFNRSNFSDTTFIIKKKDEELTIIESIGNENLIKNILFRLNHGPDFYKSYDDITYNSTKYKLFHESMILNDEEYSILTFSESKYFKPSSFHTLCDLIMEYIKINNKEDEPYYNDFFDSTTIKINSYLGEQSSEENTIYIFKFNDYSFIHESGIHTAIEFSESIRTALEAYFGDKMGVFRITLTLFIVIVPHSIKDEQSEVFPEKNYNFEFKDINLTYACTRLSHKKSESPYSIFEKIFLLEDS